MAQNLIVIPCYNEATRLPVDVFDRFLASEQSTDFLFVDDGSKDATLEVLRAIESRHGRRVQVLHLPVNGGKAEAVRQGMLQALQSDAEYIGYWDADLATPLEAIAEFAQLLTNCSDLELVCGARVRLLGRSIRRNPLRHYLGRVFATVASTSLGLPIYDTQCGAKLFRVLPHTRVLFAERFLTRWLFDVELLARRILLTSSEGLPPLESVLYEHPLVQWHDVAGSRVRPRDFVRAIFEMAQIHFHYRRRRNGAQVAVAGTIGVASNETLADEQSSKRRAA